MSIIKYSLAATIGILSGLGLTHSFLTSQDIQQEHQPVQVQISPQKRTAPSANLEELVKQRLSSLPAVSDTQASTYSDPNHSNNPLYVITNPDMQITPNFKLKEFATSGGQVQPYARIDAELVIALQHLRDHLQKPITITSSYRSPQRNKQVGGAEKSRHMSGDAVDIAVQGMSPQQLATTIEHVLGENIGLSVYKDGHVHVDLRGYKQRW